MHTEKIRNIAVVGAGLMGHGIAQEFALAGYEVHLNDLTETKLQEAFKNIQQNLQMLLKTGLATEEQVRSVTDRIHPSTLLRETVDESDMVVESASENLELKRQIFHELDRLCPRHAILASNTSTLMPSRFASATQRPDRVLVTHYFNPPYLLPLVEVVRGPETSGETVATVCDLLRKVGKQPVVVQKEVPGFIGNRLQAALLREALSIVDRGIASAQDVDLVVRNSFGRRLAAAGIFEVFEIAGWDLILAGIPYLAPDLDSSQEAPALLKEKVARGEVGIKTGKGFYEWTPESVAALRQRIAKALAAIAQWS